VRRFLRESGYPVPEVKLREARRARWDEVVVVDTRNPARLGEAWELIRRDHCSITLIDHHVTEPDTLGADVLHERAVGATCTIVASLFADRGIAPTPDEASLLLMGIYEDTGGLSYRDTTPEDLRIAAWLIEQGGALDWVRRWVLRGLQPEQFDLLNRLVEGTEEVRLNGIPVSLATVDVDRYHEEAAYVVHRWVETFELAVGIAMLVRPPHVNLILRSRVQGLHLGRVAQRFGGGGHATAASARVGGKMLVEVREALIDALETEMPPPVAAGDVAVRRIFTVARETTVVDAKDRLNQLRVNALPVTDGSETVFVGMVTRQVLDRAVGHGLGDRPVETVMQPEVPTVDAATPLEELHEVFLERSHRFVVVESAGCPVGIVTRMELFRRLYQRQREVGESLDNRMAAERPVSQPVSRMLREVAPEWVQQILLVARRVADAQGLAVYLVGGVVRDLLLGRANEDVDVVVEGDGIAFAEALAETIGGRCHPHRPFLTAVVTSPDGQRVDVASARTEFYRTPAALPDVETSLIRQDLYRRDFTINSLAIVLGGDRHGELIDFFGGRKDLRRKEIRVLHSLSFIDDPTRAIRAVRYARRLAFVISSDTRSLIHMAIREGVFERLSGQRLKRELELLLAEPHPPQSVALLADLGLVQAIIPDLGWDETVDAFLLEVEGQVAWYQVEGLGEPPRRWLLYLGGLALSSGERAGRLLAERLRLTGADRRLLEGLPDEAWRLTDVALHADRRSVVVEAVEVAPAEALLLAMAGLDLAPRRRLADAVEAAQRVEAPVSGAQLIEAGVPPGKHVGKAIRRARNAVLDGELEPAQALEFAIATAREPGDR